MARRWVATDETLKNDSDLIGKKAGRLGADSSGKPASREIFIAATVINKFVLRVARYLNFHRFYGYKITSRYHHQDLFFFSL